MSLAPYDFAASHRAAFCAARVAVGAAVSSSERGIRGVSDPLCHPPVEVQRPCRRGVAHAPGACRDRPAEPRSIRNISECAGVVARHTRGVFVDQNRPDRFCPETAFM
jgi:hypothetical protein